MLNQIKRNINKLYWEKPYVKKSKNKVFLRILGFRISSMKKNSKIPGKLGNQQKAFQIKKQPLLAVTIVQKLLESNQFGIQITFNTTFQLY